MSKREKIEWTISLMTLIPVIVLMIGLFGPDSICRDIIMWDFTPDEPIYVDEVNGYTFTIIDVDTTTGEVFMECHTPDGRYTQFTIDDSDTIDYEYLYSILY